MSNLPYSIDIDLDVFKALTARLEEAGQTHNDVLRDLLALDSVTEAEPPAAPFAVHADSIGKASVRGHFYSRGLVLPEGTLLRARYKGREYRAKIDGEFFATEDGETHDSPSAAASHITSTTVNGLRFWEAKRPGDRGWRRLDVIRDSK